MKVAVTGASGHIGSEICRQLIKKGYEVLALVHKDNSAIKDLALTVIDGDILDTTALLRLIEPCEVVFHTAGLINLGYRFDRQLYDVNVTGTQNVLEIIKRLSSKRLVHFSSVHAYKQYPDKLPLDESRQFVDDHSVYYDQTKRDSHILALKVAQNGCNVVIVCPTSAVGPPDHKPSKIGKAIIDIYKGNIPAIVSGGFDFADVRDIANGAILAMENGGRGETYILGGKYYTIKELSDLVLKVKGVRKRLIEVPVLIANIGLPFIKLYAHLTHKQPLYDRAYLDILQEGNRHILSAKAINQLGYTVRSLEETITDTINWFRENGKL